MSWLRFLILGILFNNARSQKACGDYSDCSTCAAASDCTGGQCTWCVSSNTCVPYLLNLCPLNGRVNVAYNCPRPIPDGIEYNYNDSFVRRNLTNLLCAANEGNGKAIQEVLNRLYPGIIVPNYYSVNCLGDNSINILGFGKNSSVSFEMLRRELCFLSRGWIANFLRYLYSTFNFRHALLTQLSMILETLFSLCFRPQQTLWQLWLL